MVSPLEIRIFHFPDSACDGFPQINDPMSTLPTVLRVLTERLYMGQADGAEAKEWFTGPNREPWMAKSGQDSLGDVAMPIHEAIVPWLYKIVDVTTNTVSLGSRPLGIPSAVSRGNLLLSFHRYRKGIKRQEVDPSWRADSKFLEDYAVMSCIDRVVGQIDRHNGNYMVLDDGTLFAVDNGRCMSNGFISNPLTEATLDDLKRTGCIEGHTWTTETPFVKQRIAALTDDYVDAVFDAIPRLWRGSMIAK